MMKEQMTLKWEDPCLIELTNSSRRANGIASCKAVGQSAVNCSPNGASAGECWAMGYSAAGYCDAGPGVG